MENETNVAENATLEDEVFEDELFVDPNTALPPKKKRRKKVEGREHFTPLMIFMLVVLTLYVLSMFYLMGWTFITAVKHNRDFDTGNILGFPRPTSPNGNVIWGWQWKNFVVVFDFFYVRVNIDGVLTEITMAKMFWYAFVYAAGCAFFNALVPMLTAYMCARFKFFFSKIVHTIVVVAMILPLVGTLPSELRMAKLFGLYDQLWGLWIMKANFLGMYFLVYYGNFKALPMAYTEAAKIDGAGNFDILIRIIIPLVKNTFFTIFLLYFITYWNDYNTPLVFMPSYPTIAYGLYEVTQTTQNEMSYTTMKMAASILMLMPILVLFLAFHKRLLGNLTVGGLKG